MINILIRSHLRRDELKKCIESVKSQTYKNFHLIVSVDDDETEVQTRAILQSSGLSYEMIRVVNTGIPYQWNFYCNALKAQVKDGWFFYLDSDDWLVDKFCLWRISQHLKDENVGIICQYNRKRQPKPINLKFTNGVINTDSIIIGKIGGSAIFLHHTHKNLADWDGKKAADYRFIKAIAEKLPLKFAKVVVVQTGNSGRHGK